MSIPIKNILIKTIHLIWENRNNIFTAEIESIMLASKVLKGIKKKKEVKNDLLSNMAPPIIQSCNIISSFDAKLLILNYLF